MRYIQGVVFAALLMPTKLTVSFPLHDWLAGFDIMYHPIGMLLEKFAAIADHKRVNP